jgi:hypothetical protein
MIACPLCADQAAASGSSLVLFALVALPFAIAALVVRIVRKLDAGERR